jgi:hypothetical protein
MTASSMGVCIVCFSTTFAACGETLRPALCPGDSVTVTVTTATRGLPPQFSWSPPCLMGEVAVDSGPALMWVIVTADTDRILPPVLYGQVRAGPLQLVPPQHLTRGAEYRVVVGHRVIGSPDLLFRRAGVTVFVY